MIIEKYIPSIDCLIPCKNIKKVTLDKVAKSYGYNVLIKEGNNANQNRIDLVKESQADYVIFCDDTDDVIFNIHDELVLSFTKHQDVDLIYFNFIDYNNQVYPYSGNRYLDSQFGAGPWSLAFDRRILLKYVEDIFDPSFTEYHGSRAFIRAIKHGLKIMHKPYIGYRWNITEGGITRKSQADGTRERELESLIKERKMVWGEIHSRTNTKESINR